MRTSRSAIHPATWPGSQAEDGRAECHRRVGLHAGQDVLVHGDREGRAGVAQPFADDLHRHAGLQKDGGVGVVGSGRGAVSAFRLVRSSARPPNRTCGFRRIRLSTGSCHAGVVTVVAHGVTLRICPR